MSRVLQVPLSTPRVLAFFNPYCIDPSICTFLIDRLILDSLNRWPEILEVPQYSDMRFIVTETVPLDTFQAADMKSDLLDLNAKSCVNHLGERVMVQASQALHTLTKVITVCPEDVGLELQDHRARLDAVLEVIFIGQTTYGAAAVDGIISLLLPAQKNIGEIGTTIWKSPPPAKSGWTTDAIRVPVYDQPGWRIRVQTDHILGPTLDRWDTFWYQKLCGEAIETLERAGPSQQPVTKFWWALDSWYKQHITLKFDPILVQGTNPPTLGVLIGVMISLISVFNDKGARPLRFNLLNDHDGHLGVGYLEFGTIPPRLGFTNTTIGSATE